MSNEKATARPWKFEHNGRRLEIKADTGEWSNMIAQVYKSGRCNANYYRMPAEANAELIVAAVNERDELIAEVGRLRKALAFAVKNHASWTALDWRNWINNHARAALSGKGEGE
jgi:hypothetical protein